MQTLATEGYVPFRGYRTWYASFGDDRAGRLPLVVLHGGPGATHQYLEPLRVLADAGRRVIFYDQIGCGRSDRPVDPAFFTVQTFVDELDALRIGRRIVARLNWVKQGPAPAPVTENWPM